MIYRILNTISCIKYLENNGLTIQEEKTELRIRSSSGLVYVLPNQEVVLIPSNFDPNYPGIIFNDMKVFDFYFKNNFFPIGIENMTWHERFANELSKFRENPKFYTEALEILGINAPLRNAVEIRNAFFKVKTNLESSSNVKSERLHLVNSLGLAIIVFLIDYKGYNPKIEKGYENYNPATNIFIEKGDEIQDVLYLTNLYITSNSPNAFEMLARSLGLDY